MINYGTTSNVTAFDKRTMGRGYKIHMLDGGKRKRLIIPIHRSYERHWVLCVVHPTRKSIAFFDSFANKKLWRRDVQVRFHPIVLDPTFTPKFRMLPSLFTG